MNWQKKLTSRKLWALIIAVVTSLCAAFGVTPDTREGIIGVITAVAACVVYILGEGIVDAAAVKSDNDNSSGDKPDGKDGE